jgi:hypothetical protein
MSAMSVELKPLLTARVALPETRPERRKRPPARLSEASRRRLRAVAAIVAPSRDLGFDAGEATVTFVAAFLPYLPPLMRRGFPVGLVILDFLPILLFANFSRMSKLSVDARRAFLQGLFSSRIALVRELWHAIRGLVACAIYSRPEVHKALAYAPQGFIDEMVKFRREKFGAPEQW